MGEPLEARLAAGRDALRSAGIRDDETAPVVLLPLAGMTEEGDLAIVERLALAPDAEHAAALREIEGGAGRHGWKAVAKEARRALYRFQQRGVAVPDAPAQAPAAPLIRTTPLEGYLSAIDGRGDRLVWLVRPQREGGLLVLTAVLNEPGGLRDVAIAELARKALRRMEQDLHAKHHLRLVAADGAYCDALVAEGFARARAAGVTGVGEYPAYRARMVTAEPASREPPLIARVVDLEASDTAAAVTQGAALLDEPEFQTWGLERELLAPYLAEITDVRESPLVLSRPQQEERVAGVIRRALHELFGGASGVVYQRRLEEMAFYLHATARPALALAAAATARALATSQRGGEGIAFFEALTRRMFGAFLSEDAEREKIEAESSLIVRPGAAASEARRTTPLGGRRRG